MSPEKSSQESGDPRDDIGPETMLGAEHILVRMFIFAIFFSVAQSLNLIHLNLTFMLGP